jgi:hypothetical protein
VFLREPHLNEAYHRRFRAKQELGKPFDIHVENELRTRVRFAQSTVLNPFDSGKFEVIKWWAMHEQFAGG